MVAPQGPSVAIWEETNEAHALGLPGPNEQPCGRPLDCGFPCESFPGHPGECVCGGDGAHACAKHHCLRPLECGAVCEQRLGHEPPCFCPCETNSGPCEA